MKLSGKPEKNKEGGLIKRLCRIRRILALFLCVAMILSDAKIADASDSETPVIADIATDKAMYSSGETATITVLLDNSRNTSWSGTICVDITHLENVVANISKRATIESDTVLMVTFQWPVPNQD